MRTQLYDAFGIGFAVVIGLITFVGVLKQFRRNRNFVPDNLKWFAYIFAWAVIAPLLYWWGSPAKISLADAYLLRVTDAGWTYALMGYAALTGLLLGATVSIVIKRFQNS